MEQYRPYGAPPGLFIIPEWIDVYQEQEIVNFLSVGEWSSDISKNRPTKHFGYRYTINGYAPSVVKDGPEAITADWGVLRSHADRLERQFEGVKIAQCLANAYYSHTTIGAHRDRETPLVFGLSVVADINMVWTSMKHVDGNNKPLKYEALIPKRSLYIMSNEIALEWMHEVPSRKTIKYPGPGNTNKDLNASDAIVVTIKKPEDYMRVSITYRHFGSLTLPPMLVQAISNTRPTQSILPTISSTSTANSSSINACHLRGVIPQHQEMLSLLFDEHPWQQMQSRFGKPLSRLVCNGSDQISKTSRVYAKWTELFCERVLGIKVRVHNGFANLYPNGNATLPAHKDEYEGSRGKPLWVFGLSFGETRTFSFIPATGPNAKSKAKSNPDLIKIEMESGDVLLFAPDVNETHKHQILAEPKRTGRRINITYFVDVLPGQDEKRMLNPPQITSTMIPTLSESMSFLC